ncbi:MAG: hypothetical protein MJZ34_07175 [Paludibacteraceae bacterium]|nr:hypothetical protein [Paludibacteraceae bacterium]
MEEIKDKVSKTLESFSNDYYIPRTFELCRYNTTTSQLETICISKDIKNFCNYEDWCYVHKHRDYVTLISKDCTYIVRTSKVKVL